jgi:hypothetical protein
MSTYSTTTDKNVIYTQILEFDRDDPKKETKSLIQVLGNE